jgi:hypothetical protein
MPCRCSILLAFSPTWPWMGRLLVHWSLLSTGPRTYPTGRQLASRTPIAPQDSERRPRRRIRTFVVGRHQDGTLHHAPPAPACVRGLLTEHLSRDQELRFNVHDSPDYYQLKVSVFNDDKKTELIGEAWIDLRDTVVPGGGQTDIWHQLTCRGKYAGEIRIEITFYDSRPKPEKPVVKAKPPVSSDVDSTRPRPAGPKRRPLPSDPLTGKAPPAQPAPEPVAQTPPRPQPNPPMSYIPNQSPLQQVEYGTPPPAPARYQQPDQYSPAPPTTSGYGLAGQQVDQGYRTPERNDVYSGHADQRHASPSMHSPSFDHQYQRPPQDYDSRYQVDEHGVSPDEDRPPPPPVHRSRHNSGAAHEQMLVRNGYDSLPAKGTPPTIRHEVLRNEAHRHSHSMSSGTYPGRPTYKPLSSAPAVPDGQPYLPIEAYHESSPPRHHSYDSAYDAQHRSMQPTVEDVPDSPDYYSSSAFRRSTSGAPEYKNRYERDYDQASSPAPLNLSGRGSATSNVYSHSPTQNEHHRRNSFNQQIAPSTSSRDYRSHEDLRADPPPDFYNDRGQPLLSYGGESDVTSGIYGMPPVPSSLVPGVDPSLAMEVSRRINDDRRNERRYTQPALEGPPVNTERRMIAGPSDYSTGSPSAYGSSQHSRGRSSMNHSAPPEYHSQAQAPGYSPSSDRNPSPNPQHTIKRKSISPAPPRSAEEGRRLSGVPFGPDSYNALNPTVAAVASKDTPVSGPDYNDNGMIISHDGREVDPSDHLPMDTWAPEPEPKKPTAAPSPSSRPSPGGPQSLPASGRRPLRIAGRAQTTVGSEPGYISSDVSFDASTPTKPGRNRLQKKAHRASAMPVMSGAVTTSPGHQPPSPLAPLPMHQDNFTPPRNLPRAQTFDYPNENHAPAYASSPLDGHGHHSRGGSAGGYRASVSGPPIPDKLPLSGSHAVMSGALPAPRQYDEWGGMRQGSSSGELSLMEEMQRIDIGTGRARRHGQSYGY